MAPLDSDIYYVGTPTNLPNKQPCFATLSELGILFSELGVSSHDNIEIRIISNVNDTATAEFGVSGLGGNQHYLLRPDIGVAGITITNSVSDPNSAIIRLAGIQNFTIEGSTVPGGSARNLSFVKEGNGSAISINGAVNTNIRNLNLTGVRDVVTVSGAHAYTITNNRLTRARNVAINTFNGSSNGEISYNLIGGNYFTDQVGSGIAMLDGPVNVQVFHNDFFSIVGYNANTFAFNIGGLSHQQPLNINIYNNTVHNIRTETDTVNSFVSAFQVQNASNVNIYHNTVLITLGLEQPQAGQTSIFYAPTNTSSIVSLNNLLRT